MLYFCSILIGLLKDMLTIFFTILKELISKLKLIDVLLKLNQIFIYNLGIFNGYLSEKIDSNRSQVFR